MYAGYNTIFFYINDIFHTLKIFFPMSYYRLFHPSRVDETRSQSNSDAFASTQSNLVAFADEGMLVMVGFDQVCLNKNLFSLFERGLLCFNINHLVLNVSKSSLVFLGYIHHVVLSIDLELAITYCLESYLMRIYLTNSS